jgi:hypothetical protein
MGTSGMNKPARKNRPRQPTTPDAWDGAEEVVEEPDARGGSNPRLVGEARYYCYACGSPWPKDASVCPACRGSDRSRGAARPQRAPENDIVLFDGPGKLLPGPKQGTVAKVGGPGAGKSSLAGLVQPRRWLTREQEPKPVGDMFRRILPDFMPAVESVDTPEDVRRVLSETPRGPIVLDSLTAFGLREALVVAHLLVHWAQRNNDRALAIIQLNKDGQAAGYMEIPHLFDAIVNVSPDPWGVRAFRVTKSRWSALESVYWTFDKKGQLTIPDFPAAYSVEGAPGEYWLHPYPLKGSKWNGILGAMSGAELLQPGVASSAIVAGYMPTGFLEPMDVLERKRFAEQNGLTWISAEQAAQKISETSEDGRVERNNPFGDDPEEDE